MDAEPGASFFYETSGFGPLRRAMGKAIYWRHRLSGRLRPATFALEQVGGWPLIVAPGVLNPKLMRTGEFFASELSSALVTGEASVLDMGTGSGICALVAARHGHHVTAVDISAAAVRCTRVNALLNGLEHQIDVYHGDLFAPVGDRRFDVVLFNPPFLRGAPRDDADRAWRSLDVAERFASQLREHLTPRGFALVLLSTYGGAGRFADAFRERGFMLEVVARRAYINERLTLVRVM
jgi:release factor glutamine methyltransferase